eukprot:15892518-Heterocapsa_arctica.AAC.1
MDATRRSTTRTIIRMRFRCGVARRASAYPGYVLEEATRLAPPPTWDASWKRLRGLRPCLPGIRPGRGSGACAFAGASPERCVLDGVTR